MKRIIILLTLLLITSSCSAKQETAESDVYYEIYVGSFNDSDNDSIGDLNGITEKLDYLEELGVGGIWLMPISESDTYHKYDVIDYMSVDQDYGTIEDFENLVSEAHKRGIDVIIDLVLNHTSSKHPWFREAREEILGDSCDVADSKCDYYNFSDEYHDGYTLLGNGIYYESGFWSEMPDLNLDSPDVRNEIENIVDFWIDEGVDGFRLDAVYHYYGGNVSRNNEFTSWLNEYVESQKEGAYVVGEVWTDEGTILDSYESGIDSLFNFTLSGNDGRIVSAIRNKSGQALSSYVVEHNEEIREISSTSLDAVFLSNHDQARSAGFLIGDERRKLAASLYLMMPGVPFIYYGEEIGMKGSGIDENKRTAMLWGDGNDCSSPANANYDKQIDSSVREQLGDETSLLSFYRQVLSVRNRYPFIRDAEVSLFETADSRLYAVTYHGPEDDITVVTNLSDEEVTETLNGEYAIDSQIIVGTESEISGNDLRIAPYSTVVLTK